VVDGTALEMRRTCKGSVGSNPTLSATYLNNPLIVIRFIPSSVFKPTLLPTLRSGTWPLLRSVWFISNTFEFSR
jgi:hypothetical protein